MTSPSLACIFAVLLVASAQAQTSGILREVWTNVSGSNVSDLLNSPNYPGAPVWRGVDPDFRTPANWQENYGLSYTHRIWGLHLLDQWGRPMRTLVEH